MKKYIATVMIFLAFAGAASAQVLVNAEPCKQEPQIKSGLKTAIQSNDLKGSGGVVWQTTFDWKNPSAPEGWSLPAGWEIGNSNPLAGPWVWRDDVLRGNYSSVAAPAHFATGDDGFIAVPIDEYNSVGGVTSSNAANTYIMTPEIDCSALSGVVVKFNQYFRLCCGNFNLEMLVTVDNGLHWATYNVSYSLPPNTTTPDKYKSVEVNISDVAAGKSNVRIKFYMYGSTHYFWMIDDLQIIDGYNNDLVLEDNWTGFNAGLASEVSHINYWPLSLMGAVAPLGGNIGDYQFKGALLNSGTDKQKNVQLNVKLYNGAVMVKETNSGKVDLLTLQRDTLLAADRFLATDYGDYTFQFNAVSTNYEQAPLNNTATMSFTVNDTLLLRSDMTAESSANSGGWGGGDNSGDMVGVVYDIPAACEIKSLRAYLTYYNVDPYNPTFQYVLYKEISAGVYEEVISTATVSRMDYGSFEWVSLPVIKNGSAEFLTAGKYMAAVRMWSFDPNDTNGCNGMAVGWDMSTKVDNAYTRAYLALSDSWINTTKLNMIGIVLNASGGTVPASVTFNVDMNKHIRNHEFNPAADFVDIAGTFNGWSGSAHFTDTDGDGIYTLIVDGFATGSFIEFKYRINGDWNTAEFPDGGPNRTYTVGYYNDLHHVYNDGITNNPVDVWKVDPTTFDFDGEITAEIWIDDVAVTGGSGLLAAFYGSECRGVKIGGLSTPQGKYVFIMRCYSNAASGGALTGIAAPGETLTFKYYNPDTGKTYDIVESVVFESNMTLGNAVTPTPLHAYSTETLSIELSAGWNWVSFNLEKPDMSLKSVLLSVDAQEGDYIKNQVASAMYYEGLGWFGELTTIDPKEMYKIKVSKTAELTFEGVPVDPSTPIAINTGWNWIGYLPQMQKPIADALVSILPAASDYIKDQTQSATWYDGYGWFGDLKTMAPKNGFMLRSSHDGTLMFEEPSVGTFTDVRDGHTYKWVTIGDQTWMAENLAYLPAVSSTANGSLTDPLNYVFGYEGSVVPDAKVAINYDTYGVLYNLKSAQSACPTGWHLPYDVEWKTLETFLGMDPADADGMGLRYTGNVGGKLKEAGTANWFDPNYGANNSSGFTALPGGSRLPAGGVDNLNYLAYFWTATAMDNTTSWGRILGNDHDAVGRIAYDNEYGFSVRCVKGAVAPTVTTAEVSGITEISAVSGGEVVSDGGAEVTARGVCWSVSENPSIANFTTSDGAGMGTFISNLASLSPEATYFIKAYATNSAGTSYGEEKIFRMSTFVYEGKQYGFKTIGTQTWMTENLAYLPAVSPPTTGSVAVPTYYVYGYDGSIVEDAKATGNYDTYGVLYNYLAALTACPAGWHLPTDAEWTTLIDLLGTDAGGMLKETGTNHWKSPNVSATNSTGFTALPGGYRDYSGAVFTMGYNATFWSATNDGEWNAFSRVIYNDDHVVLQGLTNRENGSSVRCLQTK